MSQGEFSADRQTLTVLVPLAVRKRGGRKQVVLPGGGSAWARPRPRVDDTLVKAIARGFRWRRLLEDGSYATIKELAAAEKINSSYVSRILRLTLLAPDLVDAVLSGQQEHELSARRLFTPFPVEWEKQRMLFCGRLGAAASA